MISVKVKDIPKFMSLLFSSEGFDNFFVSEVSIETFSTFHIDGFINKEFLNEEETVEKYARWSRLRPLCRELIKGKRTPLSMKFTFVLDDDMCKRILNESNGIHLLFNVSFQGNELRIISATSTDTFMLDKSYEAVWDDMFKKMLSQLQTDYDEE